MTEAIRDWVENRVEALLLGNRISVMEAGRLEEIGRFQEFLLEPATERVAELVEIPMSKTSPSIAGPRSRMR